MTTAILVVSTINSGYPKREVSADKSLSILTTPSSIPETKKVRSNAISYKTLHNINIDAYLINQYKAKLSDDQVKLLSVLMGSLSLINYDSADRFDYPAA